MRVKKSIYIRIYVYSACGVAVLLFATWVRQPNRFMRDGCAGPILQQALVSDVSHAVTGYWRETGASFTDLPVDMEALMALMRNTPQFRELLGRPAYRRFWRGDHFVDSWGHKLRWDRKAWMIYSVGPNGIDERRLFDDLY